jgi:DNA-binding LacI/PurR family transcriptional regulator
MERKGDSNDGKKAIISISLRRASGRDVLSGVFRHLETSSGWALRIMQPEENPLTPERLRAAEKEDVAGIFITESESPELMAMLATTPLPLAVIGIKPPILQAREGQTAFILNDNSGIGSMGANYLLKLGKFNSFGFVLTHDGAYWMEGRAEGFRTRIASALPDAVIKTFPASPATGSDIDKGSYSVCDSR